ncbi:RabGAP/TBC [Hesseltinella vesiculosa]|uniref:RabGAP/TBC n=1 Tax=Hesseltinella vesiculosa TaxID=101127 RepID=A0A1X2GAL7_9FUNG|nr:RabGAP/TBC [Hesseltinella vesiculosa]
MDATEEDYSFIQDPNIVPGTKPVKLIYSKSKVFVHPTTHTHDFIPGYISIVEKQPGEYLIAWTPEVLIHNEDMNTFVQVDALPETKEQPEVLIPSPDAEQSNMYAISTPSSNIHSVVVRPPSFTKWYGSLVINFKDGHSSTPFWFHDDESNSTMMQKKTQGGKWADDHSSATRWGGDEFMEKLSRLIPVRVSRQDTTLYYLGKATDQPSASVFEMTQMDPFIATLKEAKWGFLEKLSQVTRFSREASQQLFQASSSASAKVSASMLPSQFQQNHQVQRTMDDYDSARLFLAKWAAGMATQSNQHTPQEFRYRTVGLWGHLSDWDEEDTSLGIFEIVNSASNTSIPTHTRTDPISEAKWHSFFDASGRLTIGEPYVLESVFRGGISPSIRPEAWLFLLGVYDWDSTAEQREQMIMTKRKEYEDLRLAWETQLPDSAHLQDQKQRIDKDVHRTDRTTSFYSKETIPNNNPSMSISSNENLEALKRLLYAYNIYNSELGYVQGMSDLLSPLYAVLGDEPLAFCAFAAFMERTKTNFYMDQSGMHRQLMTLDQLLQLMDPQLHRHFQRTDSFNLFFCFRWLLVWFKREFSWNDTMTLWEVLWTNYLSDEFHLFVALSILDQHRDFMIDYLKTFDEILKARQIQKLHDWKGMKAYVNDLSLTLDVQETLQRAEILFYQFKQRVEDVDERAKEKEAKVPMITSALRDLMK